MYMKNVKPPFALVASILVGLGFPMELFVKFSAFIIFEELFLFTVAENIMFWDKKSLSFIPASSILPFGILIQENHKETLNAEREKLQGETIRIGCHQETSLLTFEDNNTKISGVLGDMWTILAEYLNFTIQPVAIEESEFGSELKNGSFTGLLGMVQRNNVDIIPRAAFYLSSYPVLDYSTPMWKSSFRLWVKPEFESDDAWIFKIFTFDSWLSIIIFMTLVSIITACFDKVSIKKRYEMKDYRYLVLEQYFYTFSTFCNQGWLPDQAERSRIVALSRRACAWLVICLVSTSLVSSMANKEMNPPFTDIGTLLNSTNYYVVVNTGSLAYDKFHRFIVVNYTARKYRKRFLYAKNAAALYARGCSTDRKYAIFEADDRQRGAARTTCTYIPTEAVYFPTWITTGMRKGFPYRRPISNGILKMMEVGMLDGLRDRWLIRDLEWPPDKYQDVDMKHAYLIFCVLGIGLVASLTIFTIEHIIVIRRRHYLRKKWNEQLRKNAERLKLYLNKQQ